MSRALPLALVQAEPLDVDSALPEFAGQVEALLSDLPQTRLVVYPELHLFGSDGSLSDRIATKKAVAEPLTGPRAEALAELAGDLGIWLLPGTLCERGEDGALYNTAAVFSPEGRLVASYRKCFPWRPYEPYRPGDRFVVFDMPGVGRFGLSICYDAWFPEVARHLAWMGAEVILNPTQTTTSDRAQELILTQANAIVNQVYVVSINVAAPLGHGRSLIADPEGRVRVEAGTSAEVLTDVIDLDDITRVRHYGTAGLNRMWEQFTNEDTALELPLYDGRIDPARWRPAAAAALR